MYCRNEIEKLGKINFCTFMAFFNIIIYWNLSSSIPFQPNIPKSSPFQLSSITDHNTNLHIKPNR